MLLAGCGPTAPSPLLLLLPLLLQTQLEKLVESNYYLHRSARDAYRSYALAYASHSLKVGRQQQRQRI